MHDTKPLLGGRTSTSRLIVGGKYSTNEIMRQAHEESAPRCHRRRASREPARKGESILDFIDTKRFTLLPKRPAATRPTRPSAPPISRGGRARRDAEAGGHRRRAHALPRRAGLLEATKTLAREGFVVMPYTNDDPIIAKRSRTPVPRA